MTIQIKHAKTNAITDWTQPELDAIIAGGAPPLPPSGTTLSQVVLPSDWNADLTTSMATGKLVGRSTAGTGSFEEITVGSGLTLSGGTLSGAGGDVVGPASSTDNAIARYDGTTGKLIQNSNALLNDDGQLTLTSTGFSARKVYQTFKNASGYTDATITEGNISGYGGVFQLNDGTGGAGYCRVEYNGGYPQLVTNQTSFSFLGSGFQTRYSNAYIDFSVSGYTPLYLGSSSVGIFTSSPVSMFHVKNQSAGTIPFIVEMAASQTANAFQIRDSSGTPIVYFASQGDQTIANTYPWYGLKPTGWGTLFYFQAGVNLAGSSTGDYTLFLNPTGKGFSWNQGSTSKFVIDATTGYIGVGTTTATAQFNVTCGSSTTVGQIIKLDASQSVDAFKIQNSSGTDLMTVSSAGRMALTTSFSAGNPIFKITATNDAGTSPYIMEVVSSSGNTMFGLSENSGNNKGVLYGIESIQGMSTIALSSSSVNSGAAINVASSNLTMGWYGAGTYSFIDSYSSVLAINSWQNTDVVISGTTAGAKLQVNTVSASKKGVLIKMAATPTANPFEIQDSSSVARFYVASDFTWKQVTTSGHLNNIIDSSTGFEGGFIFKTNGTDKWQLYNAAGVNFGIYNYGLAAAALTIQGSTNDITLGGALTVNGALTLSGSPAFACGTITSTNAANNNMILQSGATSEAGILFKASSTTKWQLYANNNDSSFRFYSFDLSKELMQCSSGGTWTFVSGSASAKAMIVKLSATQTANAWEVQDSSSAALAYFDSVGALQTPEVYFGAGTLTSISRATGQMMGFNTSGIPTVGVGMSEVRVVSGGIIGFSSHASNVISAAADTAIARNAAGIVEINNGSAGTYRDLKARAAYWSRTATATSVSSAGETIIGVTSTAAARTITLSTADVDAGRIIYIKDESGGAGTNNITIDTQGSELIDGAASITISVNYGVAKLYCDGTNWYTL